MSPDSSEDENPSQPTVKGNQQEHTTSDHQDIPASLQQERTIPEPPVTQPLTQPATKDERWHNEQKGYWERQTRAAERLNWITGIAAGIALLALIPLFIQTTTSQTTAQTAIDQLKMTKTSLQITERAWVTVKAAQAKPPVATGQIQEVAVELRNSGHSPALRIKIRHMVSVKDKLPDGPMPLIVTTGNENHGVVGPEASVVARFSPTNLTNELIAMLKSGKVYLFTFGTVKYFDIFDTEHETQFCYFIQDVDKIDMSPCGQWNEAN
jgi:hypothetical protein